MNRFGFPEFDLYCKKCGNQLSGQDGDRPAETYLGTYTGLCYTCERAGPYRVGLFLLDDCLRMSHPPHSPSWRRARESYYWYEDCSVCKYGAKYVSRSDPMGGSYYVQCELCGPRHWNHPQRVWLGSVRKKIWYAAQNIFNKELINKGIAKLVRKKLNIEEGHEDEINEIRNHVLTRYYYVLERVTRLESRIDPMKLEDDYGSQPSGS